MKKKYTKKDLIRKITEKMIGQKIIIGGNKVFYKKRYNLKYSQQIVENVLLAFFDVTCDILSEGDEILWKKYISIKPQYYKKRYRKNKLENTLVEIPAKYKTKIFAGSKLCNASKNIVMTDDEIEDK